MVLIQKLNKKEFIFVYKYKFINKYNKGCVPRRKK